MALVLTSTAFAHQTAMPPRTTCDGANVSPPLTWTGVPADAKSLLLIVDDPDAPDPAAPQRVWVHWLLYNLPVTCSGLAEGVLALPPSTLEGSNDWHRVGYGGPCPPIGQHRYFHTLYALDLALLDLHHPDKAALVQAMQGHVLAQAELIGLYQRGTAKL